MPGTHLLPPNLLKLFAPRPPLPYIRPAGKDPDRIRSKNVDGVAGLLAQLKEQSTQELIDAGNQELLEGMEEGEEPVFTHTEETQRQIAREERKRAKEDRFKEAKELYKPSEDTQAVGDPYKTLFVARLSKQAKEADLRKVFDAYGVIERTRIVRDKRGKNRGYAFIVYERERDMKAAYKESNGSYILDKRILVDVERGRTVRGWKPRRLGGGLGGRPKPEPHVPVAAAAPPPRAAGGFRGGGGGGFRGGRGGYGGGRGGGFADRGSDRGYGGRGGGGGFRGGGPPRDFGPRDDGYGGRGGGGGFRGGGPPRDFGPRDDGYGGRGGGPPGGYGGDGGYRGRGAGIGYQGGFSGGHANGYGPPGGGGGYGPPSGGYKRDGGGYDDRDAKRPRY